MPLSRVSRVGRRLVAITSMGALLALAGCGAGAPAVTGVPAGGPSAAATIAPLPAVVSTVTAETTSAATSGTSATVTATMIPPSPLNPKGTLTNADAGSTVHFQVGDTIDLALHAASGFQNWEVALPDPAVLKPTVNPAAAAVRGATVRAFQAVGAGQTAIMATSRPICAAGQACPQIVQAFKVTVIVGS